MRHKAFLAVLIASAVTASLIGCGVPKTEHDKVVKALQQAQQEKTALADQLDKVRKEKDSLSQQVAQLQNQINTLQKENDALKGKTAPKKPAAKAPAKAPAKPAAKAPAKAPAKKTQ